MKVVVLCGGTSDEREVSLRSGANVERALTKAGHAVAVADPKLISLSELHDVCRANDVVFIALHGKGGEDGSLQQMLEDWHVPYVGSDSKSSELCISKKNMRNLATKNDFTIPSGAVVSFEQYEQDSLTKKPYVIKPDIGGSSIDTFIVRNPEKFDANTLRQVFEKYGNMILEELITGTEITVGVLGTEPLPVIEIIPPQNQEFDYENKYNGQTQELCPPVHVSEIDQKAAQELAIRTHKIFGCRHMSRSDFILTPTGELYFLDINTIPGLTEQSLLPKAARQAGLDMPALVNSLVLAAV